MKNNKKKFRGKIEKSLEFLVELGCLVVFCILRHIHSLTLSFWLRHRQSSWDCLLSVAAAFSTRFSLSLSYFPLSLSHFHFGSTNTTEVTDWKFLHCEWIKKTTRGFYSGGWGGGMGWGFSLSFSLSHIFIRRLYACALRFFRDLNNIEHFQGMRVNGMIKDAHITTTQPTEDDNDDDDDDDCQGAAAYRRKKRMKKERKNMRKCLLSSRVRRESKIAVGMGILFIFAEHWACRCRFVSADNSLCFWMGGKKGEQGSSMSVETTTTLKLKHIYRCMMIMIKRLKRYRCADDDAWCVSYSYLYHVRHSKVWCVVHSRAKIKPLQLVVRTGV